LIYIKEAASVTKLAKLFVNGRSQAVRLPQEFRFTGTQVRVTRRGRGVLLEPLAPSVDDWFAELDRFKGEKFLDDRKQPAAPERNDFA
jgi:antitoxin VapB